MLDLNDPHWRRFASERTKVLGVHPNQLWHNNSANEGALIVRQSTTYDEYALSKAGLDYLVDALEGRRISAGFVGLLNRDGTLAACKPVLDVVAEVQNVAPRDGQCGLYWWMRGDLTVYSSPSYGRELPSDDVPF